MFFQIKSFPKNPNPHYHLSFKATEITINDTKYFVRSKNPKQFKILTVLKYTYLCVTLVNIYVYNYK